MARIIYFAPPTADLAIPYATLLDHAAKARLVVSPTLNPAVTLVVAASPSVLPANTPKAATCVSPSEFIELAKRATPPPPAVPALPHLATTAPKVKRVHAADADADADDNESPATSPKRARSTAASDPAAHVVVFTGTLPSGRTRGEATSEAEEHGYTVKNSITKATTILVYGDKAGAKIEQARKQGVEVLSEAEWTARLGGNGEAVGGDDDDMDVDEEEEEKPKPAKGKAKPAATVKPVAAASTSDDDPSAHTVVFTGTLPSGRSREEAIKHAEALGYTAKNSITKATTILVYGDKAGSKIDKAREQGVLVLSEAEWMARVGNDAGGEDDQEDNDEDDEPAAPKKKAAAAPKKAAPAKKTAVANSGPKKGVVVFSGTLPSGRTRGEATKEAEAAGYEVKNSITKATTILVTGEKGGSKIDKAKEQGVEVIDEDEWIARLADEAEADE